VLEEEKLNPQPALLDRGMDELLRLKEKYFFKNEVHDDHEGTEEEQAAKMVRPLKTFRPEKSDMPHHSGLEKFGNVAKLSALGEMQRLCGDWRLTPTVFLFF
jgi:hypothetical protein